jgi:hypothetical protein
MGFSVIPVDSEKHPIRSFADKPHWLTWDVIQFWKQAPRANIALRCTNIFVIDVDVHNPKINGFDSIKPLVESDWWIPTLSQTTASGGKQYIFKKPKDFEGQQIINWLPSVDIKWHENNYFVAPPSTTKKGQYRWDNNLPIAECPLQLKELLKITTEERNPTRIMVSNDEINSCGIEIGEEMDKKNPVASLFETIVYGFGDEGGRNDALARFIGGLLSRDVEPEIAYELAKIANENTPDELSLTELNTTYASILKKHGRLG